MITNWKPDFSSYRVAMLAAAICTIGTVFLADIIAIWLTWFLFPKTYDEIISSVHTLAIITTTVLAFPLFSAFIMVIRNLEVLRKRLGDTIRHDALTGLLSRETFLNEVKTELAAISETREVSDAFLIVDADFFKKINDNHGHVAGDRALVAITNALKKGVRATDRIGRLGGEEFAIHLQDVTEERAREIAERLRQNVVEASSEADIPDLQLSVSIGMITYSKNRKLVDLLIAADKLLYKAKENGRNRVEFAREEVLAIAA